MAQKGSRSTHVPKLGSISFGRSEAICIIRSISGFGAALDIAADEKIPDEFRADCDAGRRPAPLHRPPA